MTDLLRVQGLTTRFHTPDGIVCAVNGVDLSLDRGEIVGVVGESGSGKTVLSLSILGLLPQPPAVIEAGEVWLGDQNLLTLRAHQMRAVRGDRIAMIFQDPMTSLNPFLTIGDQVSEPLVIHRGMARSEANREAIRLLDEVGIPSPAQRLNQYPHEFSGGMRQRVMIAMAIALNPDVLIADEPTTALDVTIQAQILDLLRRIRDKHGTAIIMITHDLGVVAGFCERLLVMYAGSVVETGRSVDVFKRTAHPYTEALLGSFPRLDDPTHGQLQAIPGRPPDLTELPSGCAFQPRCSHAIPRCLVEHPALEAASLSANDENAKGSEDAASVEHQKACLVELEHSDGNP